MFQRSGRFIINHPAVVVLIWSLVALGSAAVAVFGVGGGGVFSQLETEQPTVPGSDSDLAYAIMAEAGSDSVNLLLDDIDLADPATAASLARLLVGPRAELAAMADVAAVADPLAPPPADWPEALAGPYNGHLLATDGRGFVLSVSLSPDLDRAAAKTAGAAVVERLQALGDQLTADVGGDWSISSPDLLRQAVNGFMESELLRGELIALPAAVVVLVVVFGGLLAAVMPAIGAVVAIVTGLGGMILLNRVTELDSVIINVITIIGMGLSIDYGLLIVSRFREELRRLGVGPRGGPSRHDRLIRQAVRQVHATAGRTVTFSALTITVCILGLVLMKASLLRGIALGGAMAVILAMLTAVTLVPAVLTLAGRHFARPSPLRRVPVLGSLIGLLGDIATDHGAFARWAAWVGRRRWIVGPVLVALLAAAAAMIGGIQLRSSGFDNLPADSGQAVYQDQIEAHYPYLRTPDLYAVTDQAVSDYQAADLAQQLGQVEHLETIVGPSELGTSGYRLYALSLDLEDPGGPEASAVVTTIRDLDLPLYLAGTAADQLDFRNALLDGLPLAGLVVVVAVFVLLFLMTGSVVVPLEALVVNALSILASLGLATWLFTTDHGFPNTGLEAYIVAVVVAFGFGLAMDYEVFLLDRVKEIHDQGADNADALARGLQRSGRIITSAASVIIVVFLGFALGDMAAIRQTGLILAILVLIDATVVRLGLVPAVMAILGRANWWAPKSLNRLSRHFAIRHTDPPPEAIGSPSEAEMVDQPV